jgi:hypothetical protein
VSVGVPAHGIAANASLEAVTPPATPDAAPLAGISRRIREPRDRHAELLCSRGQSGFAGISAISARGAAPSTTGGDMRRQKIVFFCGTRKSCIFCKMEGSFASEFNKLAAARIEA